MSLDKSLQDLFNAALERPDAAERARFLDEACGADAGLRERVEKLLRAADEIGGFMAQPSRKPADLDLNQTGRVVIPLTEKSGDKIGRYKLLQQIGEGGCGVVYMAEQEEPVRRRVALKVIKLGMDTKQVIARFEAERQALALMDHPNIARVLDAGATETGRPYFVMELVRGSKITEFCDENKLSTEDRLNLFMLVCQAIQHAHQKGVIHRDIKPSNILVTINDGVPVPKVIDFGIAKATAGRLTDQTLFTAFEQFIGTPAYMSPEQAVLTSLDIDTRSDIYSLGVLLYELLTGSPPFDQKELLAAGLDEMRRIIRETEPPRPSNRLNTMAAAALTTTAHHRHTEPPRLVHVVRGDLDWIAMKCLEKDRARRYETPNALAADIRRHLENEPIVARPPSRLYEFQRTVQRHKFGFAAAAALILVLMLGVVISTWQAVRATKAERLANDRLSEVAAERDAKEQARQEAEAISTFMGEVIQSPDPTRDGRNIQVVELLDRAAKKLETELADQPGRRADLQGRLASTYYALGLYREAIPLQEKVRDYYVASLGQENPTTLKTMIDLAIYYLKAGRQDEALKLHEEVLTLSRKVNGPEHPATLNAMHNVAISYSVASRRGEALKLHEEVLPLSRKVNGMEHPATLKAMHNLAVSYADAGRRDEALKLREEGLTLSRRVNGPEHPATLSTMITLADSFRDAGRRGEALKLHEEALTLYRKVLGPEHPDTLGAMHRLSNSYADAGRRDDALKLREEVLTIRRKVNGPEHPDSLAAMHNLAISYDVAGRRDDALKLREEALLLYRKVLGPEHSATLSAMHNLANSYAEAGRRDEALKLREEGLNLHRKVNGPEHPDTFKAMGGLAISYAEGGRQDEALKLHEEALALFRRDQGPEHPDTLLAIRWLAKSYMDVGRRDEALSVFEDVLNLHRKVLGPEHPDTLGTMITLAVTYRNNGRLDEAIKLGQSSVEISRRVSGPTHRETLNAMTMLAISYRVAGRTTEAIPLEEESLRLKRQHLSPEHSYIIESIENLAKCYEKSDRKPEAEALRQEAVQLKAKAKAK